MSAFRGKRVLITGATGLIGYNLVRFFLELGDVYVIALSRSETKLKQCFGYLNKNVYFSMIPADISEYRFDDSMHVDYLFHAAGSMEADAIKRFPVSVIKPNLIGTLNCLDFLKNQMEKTGRKGRFICFSSVTVYKNVSNADLIVDENDTGIADRLVPSSCYSESKRMCEVIVNSYVKQFCIDAVIARISTVYGPTFFLPNTAFYSFIQAAIKGLPIEISSKELPRRDNIFISDAINGLVAIALHGYPGEAYNVSSCGEKGNLASIEEIAHSISKTAQKHGSECVVSSKVSPLPALILSNTKLKKLGWRLSVSLDEGIDKTFVYYSSKLTS